MKMAILALAAMTLFSTHAYARGGGQGKGKEIRIAACSSKQAGDACSFEGRRGAVEGVCGEGKRDPGVVICKDPNRKKKRKMREKEE